jgi:hypothetical protein
VCRKAAAAYTESYRERRRERRAERRRDGSWPVVPGSPQSNADAKSRRDRQAETLSAAQRRYYVWTGPEMEIAAREDLTSKEVALKLGRTLYAVKTMREKLRRDPRKQFLAGQRGLLP